jgi:hypothetical protein
MYPYITRIVQTNLVWLYYMSSSSSSITPGSSSTDTKYEDCTTLMEQMFLGYVVWMFRDIKETPIGNRCQKIFDMLNTYDTTPKLNTPGVLFQFNRKIGKNHSIGNFNSFTIRNKHKQFIFTIGHPDSMTSNWCISWTISRYITTHNKEDAPYSGCFITILNDATRAFTTMGNESLVDIYSLRVMISIFMSDVLQTKTYIFEFWIDYKTRVTPLFGLNYTKDIPDIIMQRARYAWEFSQIPNGSTPQIYFGNELGTLSNYRQLQGLTNPSPSLIPPPCLLNANMTPFHYYPIIPDTGTNTQPRISGAITNVTLDDLHNLTMNNLRPDSLLRSYVTSELDVTERQRYIRTTYPNIIQEVDKTFYSLNTNNAEAFISKFVGGGTRRIRRKPRRTTRKRSLFRYNRTHKKYIGRRHTDLVKKRPK